MGVEIISITTASASFTLDARGGDMIVLAAAGSGQASQISAATFNGVALTEQIHEASTNAASSIWTLANPYQGSATFSISGNPGQMRVFLLRNAKKVNATSSQNSTAAGPGPVTSETLTLARSDLVIDAAGCEDTRTWTPQADQTQVVGGSSQTGISYKYADALTETMTWTLSSADGWVSSALAISPKLRRSPAFI